MNIALPHKRLSSGEIANLMVSMNVTDAMVVVFITFSQLWVLVVVLVSSVMVRAKFNLGYISKKKWQKSAKLRLDAKRINHYDILIEADALKRIAYNYSEKGVAQRAKRLSWKKNKILTKNKSEFVGQVKDRGTFDLTLTFRKDFETDFGVSFLNTLKDAQGNVFTYWGSSFLDVEVDSTITVKATIKDHREYDGTKQTVINRPKIIEGVK